MDPKDAPLEVFGDSYTQWLADLIGARYEKENKEHPELLEAEKIEQPVDYIVDPNTPNMNRSRE